MEPQGAKRLMYIKRHHHLSDEATYRMGKVPLPAIHLTEGYYLKYTVSFLKLSIKNKSKEPNLKMGHRRGQGVLNTKYKWQINM